MSNNNDIEQNIEENFNSAMNLTDKSYDYADLIRLLGSDKVAEKQFAALELNEIKSCEDAFILVSNLVGQDGKIREAVSFKLSELLICPQYQDYFDTDKVFELFLQGIMDINGNVCRNIVNITCFTSFNNYLAENLPESITKILEHIENLSKDEKQYKISKRNFQLYWALEALYNVIDMVNLQDINDILSVTAEFEDYTIREKTAKILSKCEHHQFLDLKEKLKNDENFYVKRYLVENL